MFLSSLVWTWSGLLGLVLLVLWSSHNLSLLLTLLERLQPVAGWRGEGPVGEMLQVVVLVLVVLVQHLQLWLV